MNVIFSTKARDDVKFWTKHHPKIEGRIKVLIENIKKNPYSGIGKPESLKHELSGLWSRRIDQQHRLIYSYDEKEGVLTIKSCKGHYS